MRAVIIALSFLFTFTSQTLHANGDRLSRHALAKYSQHDDWRDDKKLMVTFGDSLSDARNYFIENRTYAVRPFEPVTDDPYLIGGLHFQDGKTWIEQLAASVGSLRSALPSMSAPGFATDYAVGRARARSDLIVIPDLSDLTRQVDAFLEDFEGDAPSKATYLLWIGANDVRDALDALAVDGSGATTQMIIASALTATSDNIVKLYGAGARHVVVLNIPDLAITPAVGALPPEVGAIATQLTISYNTLLAGALQQLAALPGIDITQVDVFTLLNDVHANPEFYGLSNVTDSCITPGVIRGAICKSPGEYLFWDYIHPTEAAHAILEEEARSLLFRDHSLKPDRWFKAWRRTRH